MKIRYWTFLLYMYTYLHGMEMDADIISHPLSPSLSTYQSTIISSHTDSPMDDYPKLSPYHQPLSLMSLTADFIAKKLATERSNARSQLIIVNKIKKHILDEKTAHQVINSFYKNHSGLLWKAFPTTIRYFNVELETIRAAVQLKDNKLILLGEILEEEKVISKLAIIELSSFRPLYMLTIPDESTHFIASKDLNMLLLFSNEGHITLYNLDSCEIIKKVMWKRYHAGHPTALSHNGRYLYHSYKNFLYLFDVAQNKNIEFSNKVRLKVDDHPIERIIPLSHMSFITLHKNLTVAKFWQLVTDPEGTVLKWPILIKTAHKHNHTFWEISNDGKYALTKEESGETSIVHYLSLEDNSSHSIDGVFCNKQPKINDNNTLFLLPQGTCEFDVEVGAVYNSQFKKLVIMDAKIGNPMICIDLNNTVFKSFAFIDFLISHDNSSIVLLTEKGLLVEIKLEIPDNLEKVIATITENKKVHFARSKCLIS